MTTPNGLAEEVIDPGEAQAIAEIIRRIEAQIRRDYPPEKRPARRDAHPKHHGAVRAEFTVLDGLPPELRVGLFKEPKTYKAWIRFSNGDSNAHKHDGKRDVRGMAIKVIGVPGAKVLESERDAQTQDFLLITNRDFFVKDLADYVELFRSLDRNGHPFGFFVGLNPFKWRLPEFRNALRTLKVIGNPLGTQYWTTVPFLFGDRAARFSARPVSQVDVRVPGKADRDFLRQAMAKHLASSPAEFEFQVQLQTDPRAMPIEDPRVNWDERKSPYRTVARIHIPAQTFDSPAQMAFAENLSFTPWHCLPEHRPLGAVNRARKPIYEAISRLRHELNGVPRAEPTGDETFPDAASASGNRGAA